MISALEIERRRTELIASMAHGRVEIERLEDKVLDMRATVQRIQGAITLCDELIAGEKAVPLTASAKAVPIEDLLPPSWQVLGVERSDEA